MYRPPSNEGLLKLRAARRSAFWWRERSTRRPWSRSRSRRRQRSRRAPRSRSRTRRRKRRAVV